MALTNRQLFSKFVLRPFSSKITSKPTKQDPPKVLKMVLVESNDSMNKKIGAFLTQTFIKHEPVVLAAKLDNTSELEEYILKDLKEAKSLLIVNPESNEIVAAAVSSDTKPYTPQITRDYADVRVKSKSTKRLLYFWADMLEKSNVFQTFPYDKIWNITYLATANSMQGQGLSRFLAHQTRQLARESGYPALHMDCTSHFSAKIAKRLGFQVLQTRKVQSYVDETGKPWIPSVAAYPHGDVVITGERLPEKTVQ